MQACGRFFQARMYTIAKRKSSVDDELTGKKCEFSLKGRVNLKNKLKFSS